MKEWWSGIIGQCAGTQYTYNVESRIGTSTVQKKEKKKKKSSLHQREPFLSEMKGSEVSSNLADEGDNRWPMILLPTVEVLHWAV